ncbi:MULTISPECIES: hypothetical protein [Methylomonas]|uniref:Uncharacterized protein n=2 Tax=Methylomonas TaxID=416 RepID=A0A126T7G4_9GAMM|nr:MULTISPECIES: hypothetical protein [Methylomonas]AMK78012.1 hypothetical protein JT25_016260 [Methylomonas denitrificans]OAI07688.1 hypothetical protein A1342_10380 [Methylomonas methanica]TCV85548.1 hypothetical protein EDE11_105110 [Methylomonas methanica]
MIEQDPNARFEKAIFKLLRSFNYIDLNIGLLIASIPGPLPRDEIVKKLSSKSFDKKMKWFKSLLKEDPLHLYIGKKGVSEFEEWFLQAHEVRELRNRYVHATWNFYPMRKGSPVSISSPEWMKHILGDELEEAMSLDELESKAARVEMVFRDFNQLRKKYNV